MSAFIIAEAGVNHNGSLHMAKQLIDAAAAAGADAVKFQTFKAEHIVSRHAPKADYQLRTTDVSESQLEMIRKLELSEYDHESLVTHAQAKGIEFLSTPFDSPSLAFLVGRLGVRTIKISSGEITNAPFLLEIARSAQYVILSTGMSSLGEVEAALGVLAFGFISGVDDAPGRSAFALAFASDEGQSALRKKVKLLHCTTEYPAPFREVNLRAMDTLAVAFGLPVGYSDHTSGIHVPVAAVARGATVIEKHFTLDRNLPGPDHKASLEPDELLAMVAAIREVEAALGDGVKRPTEGEWKNREIARKSLVAKQDIRAGERFSAANVTCKRPANGASPFDYWQLVNTVALRDYAADEPIGN